MVNPFKTWTKPQDHQQTVKTVFANSPIFTWLYQDFTGGISSFCIFKKIGRRVEVSGSGNIRRCVLKGDSYLCSNPQKLNQVAGEREAPLTALPSRFGTNGRTLKERTETHPLEILLQMNSFETQQSILPMMCLFFQTWKEAREPFLDLMWTYWNKDLGLFLVMGLGLHLAVLRTRSWQERSYKILRIRLRPAAL